VNGKGPDDSRATVKEFFILFTTLYFFLSFLITGIFVHPPEQYLYLLNLIVILVLVSGARGTFEVYENKPVTWLKAVIICITIIGFLALIAANSHDGMQGSHVRFG
jgi:hypothetical protein